MNIILLLINSLFGQIQSNHFDPNGYYFPDNKTVLSGYQLEYFAINSIDYYNTGKRDYKNPKIIKPEIDILFSHPSKRFSANNILVKKDTLAFEIILSKDKRITFRGKFTDKRGQYWDQSDIIAKQTVVAAGVFSIVQANKVIATQKVMFTYWEGD